MLSIPVILDVAIVPLLLIYPLGFLLLVVAACLLIVAVVKSVKHRKKLKEEIERLRTERAKKPTNGEAQDPK